MMPTEPLIAIQAEIAQIKTILLVVSSIGGFAAILVMTRAGFGIYHDVERLMSKQFEQQAGELLHCNKLAELKALALERLQAHPNHEYARWYLARALYLDEDYEGAIREFSELKRICPSWKAEHIDPFMQEIEKRQHMAGLDK
ncbi:MAG: hypothetical protein PHP85_03875 [Gallionella sp.]|nr:hypothetical protein [Gallionella sp.]